MNEFRPVKRRRSRKGELTNSTTNFCPIMEVHIGGAANNDENRSLNKTYANPSGTDDLRAQTTYFIFEEDTGAKALLDLALVYNNKRIEFYETVKFEEDMTIISIPNHRDTGINTMIKLIKEQLLPLGTIDDVSAWAKKGTNEFLTYGMKVLFQKVTQKPKSQASWCIQKAE
ncbi:hypothetical protein AYI69_g1942 [Smittium culicis]|uniref:Uncharacterized protein n=1 Tax=Smittium culicis TaxID=133412 RepID=A0A1R1YNT8_9FUNG|nr:hypothetical protein AYI69_g1942 [Smittium culicis]